MIEPTLILFNGQKQSGKDTCANIVRETLPGRVRTIAIADWFKEVLSNATGFDLQSFYDCRKDLPYREPLALAAFVIKLEDELIGATVDLGMNLDCHGALVSSLNKFVGRKFESNRKLMEWLGFELIHDCFGSDEVHCRATLRGISKILRADPHCRVLIITDARTFDEQKYLSQVWRGPVHKIKVERPGLAAPNSGIEKAVSEFPPNWFDKTIHNNSSFDHLWTEICDALTHFGLK